MHMDLHSLRGSVDCTHTAKTVWNRGGIMGRWVAG